DTLFLALPVAWQGTLVQYAGRLHRLHPGKRDVRIFDYVDRAVPVLARMFERRRKGYRAIGYVEADAEVLAAYDDDVIAARDHASASDDFDGDPHPSALSVTDE
ncbi:MAG: hypothetical protein ACHREM_22300, partial [Polyangiales bacterium]